MTPRSRRISPLPRSLACLHCEKPVVSLFPHPSPFPPNRISIWGECNRWNSRDPESHRCKFHATLLLLLLLRWHRSIQGENKSSSRFMNRFNQILINAAPPSDDHGSKYIYIYIYILLSVDRYIVWQFYHGMYIYISTSSDISRFHWISKPISHRIYGTTLQSHSFFPPPLHSFRKLKSIELLSLWSFFWKEPLPVSPVFRVERNSNLPDNFSDPI